VMRPWRYVLGPLAVVAHLFAWPSLASAHEVRPAFLQITELSNGRYDVLWKQPSQGTMAVRLIPHLSGGMLEGPPGAIETAPNFQIQIWRDIDAGTSGLEGRTLEIEGLRQTITDVLVSISLANGDQIHESLRPQNPLLVLHLRQNGLAVPTYLILGVEHILTGADHLCFVLGLLLLVRNRVMLLKTITAFTLAHSITLVATTVHMITVRPALVEALVALSILFVAVELVHFYRGREGLTVRFPWLIAFTFGLLHGAAFAGALAQIGLPPHAIPLSLLLFNVGVELGQILFVMAMLGIGLGLVHLPRALPVWTRWVPPYAIGTFAAVWFLERIQAAIVNG
jgi:hydrogenase/urease accessory protein HupE